jgi:hypothetical protein
MKLALAGVGALALQAGVWSQAGKRLDDSLYDELAGRWLARHGANEATAWRELVAQHFVHLSLGAFELHMPAEAFEDGATLGDTRAALEAVVALQHAWGAWAAGEDPGARKPDVLDKWLAGWSAKTFGKDVAPGTDLAAHAGTPAEVRAALDAFEQAMRHGGLGLTRELAGVPLVVFPKRGDFVEFTCVAGSLDATLRPSAFHESLTTWLEYSPYEVRFLALEYGGQGKGIDYRQGTSVGDRNPAALGELVTQVATRALLANAYGATLDPALQSGLANALVIALYGELDTRIDGDVKARSSQGRSIFVPGGNPDGGVLPPTSAENRWRGTKGKDHFLGVLAQVQKQAGKKGKGRAEKLASFELASDAGAKQIVSAPFLGSGGTKPEHAVWADYLELVRCYGVGFLHWMREHGAARDSHAKFGEFLRGLEGLKSPEELPNLFREVYSQPLSASSLSGLFEEATLEGRFLTWLAK